MSYFERNLLPALESLSNVDIDDSCKRFALLIVKALVPRFESVEWSTILSNNTYSTEFFVTINGKQYQCYELADLGIVDESELLDSFEAFYKFRTNIRIGSSGKRDMFKFTSKNAQVKDIVGDGILINLKLWGNTSSYKLEFQSVFYENAVSVDELLQVGVFLDNPVPSKIQRDVIAYLTQSYSDWCDPKNIPKITPNNFWNEFSSYKLFVVSLTRNEGGGFGVGIMGECNADPEHGLSILVKNGKVINIGQQGDIL